MALPYYQVMEKYQMGNNFMGGHTLPVVTGISGQLFQPKLIPRLHEALRFRRYSFKTEKAYVQWVTLYLLPWQTAP